MTRDEYPVVYLQREVSATAAEAASASPRFPARKRLEMAKPTVAMPRFPSGLIRS